MKFLVCFLFVIQVCVLSKKHPAIRVRRQSDDNHFDSYDSVELNSDSEEARSDSRQDDKSTSSEELTGFSLDSIETVSPKKVSSTTNYTNISATTTIKYVPNDPINNPTTVATKPTTVSSSRLTKERRTTTEDVNIKNQIPKPENVELSPIIVYSLGTMLIIMFIVILFLMYYLCKRKHKEYRMYTGPMYIAPNSPIGMQSHENGQELREVAPRQTFQHSDNRSIVDPSEIAFFKPQKETVGLGTKKAPPYDNEIKTNRMTSKVGTNNNVIPREKILQICKDALSKHRQLNSETTKDLNHMFQELSAFDSISLNADDMKKKSASTSMLDLYDVPQGFKKNGYNSIELEESPVYQNPFSASTRQVELLENDTQYLMPLSGETKTTIEPTYINAYFNH